MSDKTEIEILTTRISIKTIGFSLVGAIFFGAFVYLMLPTSKWKVADGTDYTTGMTIIWVVFILFIFFSASCVVMLFALKTIILTDKNIIIRRPLIFFKLTISLSNIKCVVAEDYKINPSHRGMVLNVFHGEQTVIELKNGKKIKYNSLEIPDYYILTSSLNELLRGKKKSKLTEKESLTKDEHEGYGWLIFIIILTFGLVYSIIQQRL